MKKLEDIPKRNIFEVPKGYFDRLPGVIEARVSARKPSYGWNSSWAVVLRYAVAVLLVVAIGFFWYNNNSIDTTQKINSELASINSDQLVQFLDEHEMSTDDLVEKIAWSPDDLNELENSVYSGLDANRQEIEKTLNEFDTEL